MGAGIVFGPGGVCADRPGCGGYLCPCSGRDRVSAGGGSRTGYDGNPGIKTSAVNASRQ